MTIKIYKKNKLHYISLHYTTNKNMPTQFILTTNVTINMAGTNANFTNRERCKFPKSLTWWNMFKLLCCTICPKVWSKHRIFWEVKGLLEKPSLLAQIPTSWLTWLLTKPTTGTTLPWLIRLLRFDPFHDAFPSHLSQPLQKKRLQHLWALPSHHLHSPPPRTNLADWIRSWR